MAVSEPSLRGGPCHDTKARPAASVVGTHAAALACAQVTAAGYHLPYEIPAREAHQQPEPEFHDATPGCWPGVAFGGIGVTCALVKPP